MVIGTLDDVQARIRPKEHIGDQSGITETTLTYTPPSRKMQETPNFFLLDISSPHTMGIGKTYTTISVSALSVPPVTKTALISRQWVRLKGLFQV